MVTTLFGNSNEYVRASPSRIRLLGSSSLWEAGDHFVQIDVLAFHETHRRFFFKDIRAFTLSRSRRGEWMHLFFGLPSLALVTLLVWRYSSSARFLAFLDISILVLASFFLVSWVIHALLGPTCVCHVVTGVQTERLHSLSRLRSGRKTVERLAHRVRAAQGTELPDTSMLSPEAPAPVRSERQKATFAGLPLPVVGSQSHRLPLVLAAFGLLNGLILLSHLLWDSRVVRLSEIVFALVLIGLAIGYLALPRSGPGLPAWVIIGSNALLLVLWYGFAVFLSLRTQLDPGAVHLAQLRGIAPSEHRLWFWVIFTDGLISLAYGSVILLSWIRARRPAPAVTPPSSAPRTDPGESA